MRRTILAIIAGYAANAALVTVSEIFLSRLLLAGKAFPPPSYYDADLLTQCFYTVVGGYLCCAIAGQSRPTAMVGLIGMGLVVGTISLYASWKTEPRWYGMALLLVYPPCVWLGWKLRATLVTRSDRHRKH